MKDPGFFIFFSVLTVSGFLYLLYLWVGELRFYSKHGWDFTKDSGLRGIGPGDESTPPGIEFSPKVRVLFALPMMMAGLLTFSIAGVIEEWSFVVLKWNEYILPLSIGY